MEKNMMIRMRKMMGEMIDSQQVTQWSQVTMTVTSTEIMKMIILRR